MPTPLPLESLARRVDAATTAQVDAETRLARALSDGAPKRIVAGLMSANARALAARRAAFDRWADAYVTVHRMDPVPA